MHFWQWLSQVGSNWECQCAAPLEAVVTLSAGAKPKLPFKTLQYWLLAVRLVENRVGRRQIVANVRFRAQDVSFPRRGTSRVQFRYKKFFEEPVFFLLFFLLCQESSFGWWVIWPHAVRESAHARDGTTSQIKSSLETDTSEYLLLPVMCKNFGS